MAKIRVTAWNEFRHERSNEYVKSIYPDGIHGLIKQFLETKDDIEVTPAALDDPDNGLPDEVLSNTDVLIWWGHMAHHEVPDALVERIRHRVYTKGMGLIVLHSGHHSKVFRAVVGTNGNLSWGRDQKEVVWNLLPSHPIAAGIPDHFVLETEELYCEPFYVPQPDALVFGSWFEDGFIFRSGLCYTRGAGKVFYFQPGHESCPSYHNRYVQKIITNAVYWAKPAEIGYTVPEGAPMMTYKPIDEFKS